MKTVLTIAGSDSSGGAGIQADIKTITAHGLFATSAITALTAQNTLGVTGIQEATPDLLRQQLDCIFTDIRPDAVKIGMVANIDLILVIADRLRFYQATHVVLDPVMVSTSGSALLRPDAETELKNQLMPIAEVITPNVPEAEKLSGMQIRTSADMETAARIIHQGLGPAVLVKGGHQINDANDYLFTGVEGHWFNGERIDNPNTHGTGCTLSSAIACNLARETGLIKAVENAKAYISGALRAGLDLGQGSGPLDHMFCFTGFGQ